MSAVIDQNIKWGQGINNLFEEFFVLLGANIYPCFFIFKLFAFRVDVYGKYICVFSKIFPPYLQ